jgi:hypothetical protein
MGPAYLVIGLAAGLHAGKTFMAQRLQQEYPNALIVSFADHFKVWWLAQYRAMSPAQQAAFQAQWGFEPTYENFFVAKTPASRHFLQQMGTEEGRQKYGDRIWLEALALWMLRQHHQNGITLFILDDCRFANEFQWVEAEQGGILIQIYAPDRTDQGLAASGQQALSHASEQDMRTHPFQRVVDNRIGHEGAAVERLLAYARAYTGDPYDGLFDFTQLTTGDRR